jgi:hypothetical protein
VKEKSHRDQPWKVQGEQEKREKEGENETERLAFSLKDKNLDLLSRGLTKHM